jgi:hypothetical protein
MKYDRYRVLLAIGDGDAVAYTRSGLDWSEKFAGMVAEAAKLKVPSALIDGEAVVFDREGRSSLQARQAALITATPWSCPPVGGHAPRRRAPAAAPITWKEMETIHKPSHFHIGDAAELLNRAASKALARWGRAHEVLSDL